jgi:nitrobindin-like protein
VDPPLHPEVLPLAFLLGTWEGEGHGEYPTIKPFAYGEEIRFWHVGKPFLAYSQRTWALDDGRPLHAEMGYWRPQGGGRIELVMAHPTGVAEVSRGTFTGSAIDVASTTLGRTGSAKEVTRLERSFRVDGDVMTYELRMAAVGVTLTHHLSAELKRS